MSDAAVWLALAVGGVIGALATLVWRTRREQALRIESELLRARLKTEETVATEREQTLARAREQLQGVFGELARDSLQSNSEVFLQLARERLTRLNRWYGRRSVGSTPMVMVTSASVGCSSMSLSASFWLRISQKSPSGSYFVKNSTTSLAIGTKSGAWAGARPST